MSLLWRRRGAGEERAYGGWSAAERPGRSVTPETAPTLAPVFAALRHIVDYASTLPVDSYRLLGEQRQQVPLPQLLRVQDQPGRAGIGQWLGQAAYGMAAFGNAVGWIMNTDGYGYPTEVLWLARTAWDLNESTRQWYVNGQPVDASRIFHIPWLVPPGKVLGLSPIECYAAIARAGMSAQDYADVQRGGGVPPSVLRNTRLPQLTGEQSMTVRDRASAAFATGKPFVTGADWDLTLLTIPPNHAQFIETLKLSANQIAAIYGIDPREIGGSASESLTYTNDESRALNRAHNMRPYLVRLEQAIDRNLPLRQVVRFNTDATVRADVRTRTEVVGLQIADGRLSVNEARALEDRPPVSGGDYHNVPTPPGVAPTPRKEPS